MPFRFSRPMRRPNSSVPQFRKRPPADLLDRARGQRITFHFPAEDNHPASTSTVTVGEFVQVSLRARTKGVAERRD